MDGAIGVKTGFTNGAGYCFVGAVQREGKTLVSVVLGCGWPPSKNLKWVDTGALMNYGLEHYMKKQIVKKTSFQPIFVKKGQQRYEYAILKGSLSLLVREDEQVRIQYQLPSVLQAPIKKGTIIGYANYFIDQELYARLPIRAKQSIDVIDLKYCFVKLVRFWSLGF